MEKRRITDHGSLITDQRIRDHLKKIKEIMIIVYFAPSCSQRLNYKDGSYTTTDALGI